MAVQMHVIYSDFFKGLGVVAGGPFYCAEGDWDLNGKACTVTPEEIDLDRLENTNRQDYLKTDTIADPENIKGQPVWIFSGTVDTIVVHGVSNKLNQQFSDYGANIKYVNTMVSEHGFPTDLSINKTPCTYNG